MTETFRMSEAITQIFLMVLLHIRFFYFVYLFLPIYLLESIFITFIITSYMCHRATLEIEVVQWLRRLPCREFAEFLISHSFFFNIYLTLTATYGSHLYASCFKRAFSFLQNLLESNQKTVISVASGSVIFCQ